MKLTLDLRSVQRVFALGTGPGRGPGCAAGCRGGSSSGGLGSVPDPDGGAERRTVRPGPDQPAPRGQHVCGALRPRLLGPGAPGGAGLPGQRLSSRC